MIKKHIPNFLTCCNLLCGCLGIYFVFADDFILATYLIWTALVLDFLDGFAARMLKVSSPIGKELDSLADMVTFGVLPSFMMFYLLSDSMEVRGFVPFLAFTVAVFSALRLANFNVDERQHENFIGLPTPANALFLSSLVFLKGTVMEWILMPWPLLITVLLFSLLLVAPLPLFSLKFKSMRWSENKLRINFLLISLLCLLFFRLSGIPLIILVYLLLSTGSHIFAPNKKSN
jgi:CDP-diacylglycerol--serine O-phosphatidyltransferase